MIKCVFWLCTLYRIVFAGENRFLVHEEPKSWISETDYRTMLKESFPSARCCNVFINGTFHEVEQSLNDFLRVYSYSYIILQSTYDCQGYLLISSTEENLLWALSKVPSTISSTEILIIYDSDLLANSRLFNGSIYNNANVNLVAVSGIWSLSENFLQPRNFEKIERYTDLRYKNGLSNFKGRELQIASYYNPPMMYLKRTVKKTVNGIKAEIYLTDNESERDGIELQIFMLIAERLNFTWSIRSPPGEYRYGRRIDNNTWEGGMVSQLLAKEVDLAFGGIWLKADHNMFTNLTGPWGLVEIRFLVPRPKSFTSFWALTKPFTPLVWTSVILSLLWQTCYMTIRARVKPQESTKRFRRFSYTCMELMGRLIGMWMPRGISGVKIQLQFWQIAGLILVTAYCSSLAATLTGAEYEERIDTVKQFVEAGLTWGKEGPLPIFNEYVNLNDKYSAILPQRFKSEKNDQERHLRILEGKYGILGRLVGGVFFPDNHVEGPDFHNYRLMMNPIGGYYLCFAMQPWLVDKVNMMMLWAIETGFTSFYLKDVIHRRASSSLREVLVEHDKNNGTTIALALTPLASGFVMLTVGLTVASVVFLFELFSENKPEKSSNLMYPKNRESDVAKCDGKKDFRQALKELNITKLIKPSNTKHRRNQCSRIQ